MSVSELWFESGQMPAPPFGAHEPAVPLPSVNYHAIVADAISDLSRSTAAAREKVYARARAVVHDRLAAMPLSKSLIDLEKLTLELAFARIEADAARREKAEALAITALRAIAAALDVSPADALEPLPIPPPTPAAVSRATATASSPAGAAPKQAPPTSPGKTRRRVAVSGRRLAGVAACAAAIFVGCWIAAGSPAQLVTAFVAKSPARPAAVARASPQAGAPARPATPGPAAAGPDMGATRAAPCGGGDPSAPPCHPVDFDGRAGGDPKRPPPFWIAAYHGLAEAQRLMRQDAGPPEGAIVARLAQAPDAASEARALNDRATASIVKGKPDHAIRDLNAALRIDPDLVEARVNRGELQLKQGHTELALADLNEAIRLDPRQAAALRARATALLSRGDDDPALADLTRAIQAAEGDAAALPALDLFNTRKSRAALYERKQMYDREIADLSGMIDQYWQSPALAAALKAAYPNGAADSLMASVYRLRASIYVRRSKPEAAVADLSLALQLDGERSYPLLIERARILESLGRREQATADLQKAVDMNPSAPEARAALQRLRGQPS